MLSPQPAQQYVGDYLIVNSMLQAGSTGKVKVAVHKTTNQKVAIKVINKKKFQEKQGLERKIRREIALMRLFDHPHILKLVEVCESQSRLYIILEYAEHGELFDYLIRQRTLSVEEGISLFRELVYGLDFLHRHAICHRDLKPENILLDAHDRVKIADFGFARWMRADVAETSCGSPHYAAPEVIRGMVYDGRAADVWSCGVILYALLAGHLPFDDPSIRNLMAKVKMGRYQMPAFSPEIQDLVARMLTVDVTKRITLEQIKAHPAFHIGYPRNYTIPSPLPLPSLPDPIDTSSLDPKIFKVLLDLGYFSEGEVKAQLESTSTNMAKVFVHMLTSSMSLEWLPWDGETGEEEVPAENFLIDENPIAFAAQSGPDHSDPFHRRRNMQPMSLGSPDLFSFVQKSTWGGEGVVSEDSHESNVVTLGKITITLPVLMASLQQLLIQNSCVFFHPNDETLITRFGDANLFVVIQAVFADPGQFALKVRQVNGSPRDFSLFLRIVEDFLDTFS